MNTQRRALVVEGMHHEVLICRIVSTLQLNNLRVLIDGRNRLAGRFDELQTTDAKRVITVRAAILIECLVNTDLGMRKELFLGEVR